MTYILHRSIFQGCCIPYLVKLLSFLNHSHQHKLQGCGLFVDSLNSMVRSRFAIGRRMAILQSQQQRNASNVQVAHEIGCSEGTIRRWRATAESFAGIRPTKISSHRGRPRANHELERRLLAELDRLMFYGIPLSQQDVIRMALVIMPNFKDNNRSRLASWASTFLRANRIVLRRVTQYGRRIPMEVEIAKERFLARFTALLVERGYDEEHILNLDQTGIFFECPRATTLAPRGASQVSILASRVSVRATAVLTVTMGGRKLPPYVIFKGARGGRGRVARSFSTFPAGQFYDVQPAAWMDTQGMLRYIDMVLRPFFANTPRHPTLLILDSFAVHLQEDVQRELRELGVDLLYIPAGMTGLLQPLDISINKVLKDNIRTSYTGWLVSQSRTTNILARRPKPIRQIVAEWLHRSWNSISNGAISSAFDIYRERIAYEQSSLDLLVAATDGLRSEEMD